MTSNRRKDSIVRRQTRQELVKMVNCTAMSLVETISALKLELNRRQEALRDLLALYDKMTGAAPEAIRGEGWSWAQMKRLAEIRGIVEEHQ